MVDSVRFVLERVIQRPNRFIFDILLLPFQELWPRPYCFLMLLLRDGVGCAQSLYDSDDILRSQSFIEPAGDE